LDTSWDIKYKSYIMADILTPDQLAHGDNASTQRHAPAASDTNTNASTTGAFAVPPRFPLLTTIHNIPVLKGFENFSDWKGNAEALIVSHKRFYVLQEVNVPLTSTSVRRIPVDPLQALIPRPYREDDREDVWSFLRRCIHSSISGNFSWEAMDPTTADAAGLWKEMHERFDTADIQTAGRYSGKLWKTQMMEDGNAQDHINRFMKYFNVLTKAIRPPKDEDFATALLLSLPVSQYGTLRTIKLSDPNINSRNVKASILAEW
jgi:hypothetical protein